MRFKKGISLFSIRPELLAAISIANEVWKDYGQDLVITEVFAMDGHSLTSDHYDGRAADLRTRYFPYPVQEEIVEELKERLGQNPDYIILLEETHIHISFHPKRRD